MELEQIVTIILYIHAGLGALALLSGLIALGSKKGGGRHKKSGKVFHYSLLGSTILSLIVSVMPNHKSSFLFAIGVFSIYLIVGGYRALRFKKELVSVLVDKIIAIIMLVTAVLMISGPYLITGEIKIILLVFGVIGLILSISDLIKLSNLEGLRKTWLSTHISKMVGGYIAAVSAFLVVNNFFPTYFNWFGPTILGLGYISYWTRKIKVKRKKV